MNNWWPFGRYTRFLERTLAESRADFLERLRDKDQQIRWQREYIGSLEARMLRLDSQGVRYSRPLGNTLIPEDPKPAFGKTEDIEEYGDWQSQLERAIAGVNHEAPKEEAANAESRKD